MPRIRKTTPEIGITMWIRTVSDTGKVQTHRRKRKKAFTHLISRMKKYARYELFVNYYPEIGNSGSYDNKDDLLEAFLAFTNIQELRFIKKYWKDATRPSDLHSKS